MRGPQTYINRSPDRGEQARTARTSLHAVPDKTKAAAMASSVARVTEISATSDTSFEDAIRVGVDRATQTLRGVTSAWVKEQEVEVTNGQISFYKVNLLITFVLQ
jgi:flavin-binding protein dodecin